MDCHDPLDIVLSYMPGSIRTLLERAHSAYAPTVQEITLRAGLPLCIDCAGVRYYLTRDGCLIQNAEYPELVTLSATHLQDIFDRLCEYSVYARQDELRRGYVTARGGLRVGVCGTAVVKDDSVAGICRITTLSFRVPREVKGCAGDVLRLIRPLGGALVCGPPCSGKTTLIRDMARLLSYPYRVSVIDERGELSGGSFGSVYDTGLCDVYMDIPKGDGVQCAVRSMSPDVIVCDELGDERDVASVRYALRCGAAFIATVHAATIDDLRSRPVMRELLETGAFRYLIFLADRRKCGRITRIYEWEA